MFQQQLLKLINRLIEMTEAELILVQQMDLKAAAILTEEKDPLVRLYQECVHKINVDQSTRDNLKAWPKFDTLKERVAVLDDLSSEYEQWIKRIERSQRTFIESVQEKLNHITKPVKSYNKRGSMTATQPFYTTQSTSALSALDQTL